MDESRHSLRQEQKHINRLTVLILLGWTLIIAANLIWDVRQEAEKSYALAATEARSNFNKDKALRFWAASHGGIYVPANERTPPNPKLAHVSERDILTPSGKKLTLMNPSYMLRQIINEYTELYGVRGKITSNKLLNPDNAPDAWEKTALLAFSSGEKEIQNISQIDGSPYLRLMQPLHIKEACIKCHGHQNDKEGELCGGISVAVSMAPYLGMERQANRYLFLTHSLIWALVAGAILIVSRLIHRRLKNQLQLQSALISSEKQLLHEKQQLTEVIWGTHAGTWTWDIETGETNFNERWVEMVGYTLPELQPFNIDTWTKLTHPEDLAEAKKLLEQHFSQKLNHYECELRMRHKDGHWIWTLARGKVVEWSGDGRPLRMSGTHTDITARKLAEESLQRSEARYRQIFETNQSVKLIIDPADGAILKANNAACRFYGYDVKTLTSLRITDINILSPEEIKHEMRQATEEKRLYFNFSHKLASGEIRDVEVYSGPLQSGDKTLLYSIIHDISERKQVEKALQSSEERYRMLVESTAAVLWEFDFLRGRFTYVSPQAGKMLGYSSEEWTDIDSWAAMIHPDDREAALDLYTTATGNNKSHEYRIISPDGQTVWVKNVLSALTGDDLSIHLQGVMFDITEAKTAEAQIHAALTEKELLISAIEQAAETIIITDTEAKIQYANPAFERITGYTREEAIGQKTNILKSGEQSKQFYRELWDRIQAGKTWNGRLVNKKKDGTLYTEDATISPVHNTAGEIINFVAVKRDITEEISLEAQLRQAQKLEVVGTLASGIAHDFNNILTPILGYAQLMHEQKGRSAQDYEHLSIILTSSQRAKALVEQVLDFARNESDLPQALQLKTQLEETSALLRASIPATIQLNLELQDLQILTQPARIHQVVLNLCTNAAQAMNDTGGQICIRTEQQLLGADNPQQLRAGRYVQLSVQDDGPGIAPQVLPKIFDPYFTTKEVGEGSGIGLATVQRIVASLGGHIEVESQLGLGTNFIILLPLVEDDAPEQSKLIPLDLPQGNKHLLLVDDEELLLSISSEFLQNLGYCVTGFTDSEEALQAFENRSEDFDLLISDLTMPRLTGRELARRINQIDPDFPIILCTGQQNLPQKQVFENIKLLKILQKPDLFAEMAFTLHQHFND